MNKNLLLILFFFIAFIQVKATDWFPIGAKWYWSTWCLESECAFYTIEITKDTVIHNKTYQKGEFTLFNETYRNGIKMTNATILFINENGKINYRFRDSTYRLYNINLNVGDTMFTDMTLLCNNFISAVPEIKDTILVAKSIVDSVNTIELNGVSLKQLYLHSFVDTTETNYFKGSINFNNTSFSIIEKIGLFNSISFFGYVTNAGVITGGEYGSLRCYEDNEVNFHKFNNSKCDTLKVRVTSVVNNKLNNAVSIFPNPANNELILKPTTSSNIVDITIYNSSAELVYKSYKLSKDKINIDYLPKGIYIININLSDNTTQISKILKE